MYTPADRQSFSGIWLMAMYNLNPAIFNEYQIQIQHLRNMVGSSNRGPKWLWINL